MHPTHQAPAQLALFGDVLTAHQIAGALRTTPESICAWSRVGLFPDALNFYADRAAYPNVRQIAPMWHRADVDHWCQLIAEHTGYMSGE